VKPEEKSPGSHRTGGWVDSGAVPKLSKKGMKVFHLQEFEAGIEQTLA
jgi:hypothetical protein